MMEGVARIDALGANPADGRVVWSPVKSLWNGTMLCCTVVFAPLTATPGAVVLFVVSTWLSLLLGHSVGMHRRFIHRSYDCSKWRVGSPRPEELREDLILTEAKESAPS